MNKESRRNLIDTLDSLYEMISYVSIYNKNFHYLDTHLITTTTLFSYYLIKPYTYRTLSQRIYLYKQTHRIEWHIVVAFNYLKSNQDIESVDLYIIYLQHWLNLAQVQPCYTNQEIISSSISLFWICKQQYYF